MRPSNDLSRSLITLACDATVIAVVELSQKDLARRRYRPGDQSASGEENQLGRTA
jgi:hypothetical protein